MSAQSSRGKRSSSGRYLSIPHAVTDHPDYMSLSGKAVKLLNEITRQYNGKNNGDLSCTMTLLKNRGYTSNDQITSAKKELISKGLIVETKRGGLTIGPSLFAITWRAIDECKGKHDFKPTIKPYRGFSLNP